MTASHWRGINIALCLFGVLVFGGMLLYLQSVPRDLEARAQTFIIDEIDGALAPDSAMSKLAQLGEALPLDRIDALGHGLASVLKRTHAAFNLDLERKMNYIAA
jgi:hypothetical protein